MHCCTYDPIVQRGVTLPVRETFRRQSLLSEEISKLSSLHILLLVLLLLFFYYCIIIIIIIIISCS